MKEKISQRLRNIITTGIMFQEIQKDNLDLKKDSNHGMHTYEYNLHTTLVNKSMYKVKIL